MHTYGEELRNKYLEGEDPWDYEGITNPNKMKFNKEEIEQIIKNWKNCFSFFLENWGFNESAIEALFEWGESGHNWDKLHYSDEEWNVSLQGAYDAFYWEYQYCCDRMSMDRLFRTHHKFNLFLQKYKNIIK